MGALRPSHPWGCRIRAGSRMIRRIDPDYLRATAQTPAVRALKTRGHELLQIQAGDTVVDVGCGPGIDTIELARLVGPGGAVVGIDGDLHMIEQANRLATAAGVGAIARHVVGNATYINLGSESADAVYCERVLQHVTWPGTYEVGREIQRILKSGGRLVIIDTDWASLSVASPDPWLERRIVAEHVLGFANPFSGRQLPALLANLAVSNRIFETYNLPLSFDAVEFLLRPAIQRGIAAGRISTAEGAQWWHGLGVGRDYGLFFAHVSMVLAAARKI
ncbi:methyltransferase domain-containing protein, partial [Microvirga massiliensis]|uniref:methyltransferase domain-containing protein n=1 Tax=Microvirga massiliensis TaxID=1033741 RepID=UPI0009E2EFFB